MNSILGILVIIFETLCFAKAPPRTGQPYAESICDSDPNIIFCEDFNYPANFYYSGVPLQNSSDWKNPGLTNGLYGFVYGLEGRKIATAASFLPKPIGSLPSGAQADHVWSADGALGNGSTWGDLRSPGGNYANGTTPAKDFYVRFQYFVTPDYVWPGGKKSDIYNWGESCQPYDNKILYIYPPGGHANPTNASYDAGMFTAAGMYDSSTGGRFADAIGVRYGNTSDNYKSAPLCSQCSTSNQYNEYGYQSVILRNPGDKPTLGKAFRFDAGKWYTVEMRYKLGSAPDVRDGLVEVWIDDTKIYSFTNIATCGSGDIGDCSGLGEIYIGAYHNGLDCTKWQGSQVIDNLVISRSKIGLPSGAGGSGGNVVVAPKSPNKLRIN